MSTSPRRAPAAAIEDELPRFTPFPYGAVSAMSGTTLLGMIGGVDSADGDAAAAADREAQALARGRQAGQLESRQAFEQQLAKEKSNVAAALAQFARDRSAYFGKVEPEMVQLAMSIARKILHREVQVDPMPLAGIVRVALEQIEGATGVRLRVHPQKSADWRQFLTTQLQPANLPEIVEDPSQPLDHCTVETAMGSTAIGLEIQLKEIEQGFARRRGHERLTRSVSRAAGILHRSALEGTRHPARRPPGRVGRAVMLRGRDLSSLRCRRQDCARRDCRISRIHGPIDAA
jgi:flagellar biosynthesis/type III secretory pathway protein FliH